jgi:hypothetical protein
MRQLVDQLVRYAPIAFSLLIVSSTVEAIGKTIPPDLFYAIWVTYSVYLACLVSGCLAGYSEAYDRIFLVVVMTVIALCLIFPLDLPVDVLSNYSAGVATAKLTNHILDTGHLSGSSLGEISYVQYPLAILQLAIAKHVTDAPLPLLYKSLSLFESVLPTIAIYSLIKPRQIALPASLVGGLAPYFVASVYGTGSLAVAAFFPIAILLFEVSMPDIKSKFMIPLIALIAGITLTDVFDSLALILILTALVTFAFLRRLKVSNHSIETVLATVLIWFVWYVFGIAGSGIVSLVSNIWNSLISSGEMSTKAFQSIPGGKPIILTYVEYTTFLALLGFSIIAIYYFRSDKFPHTSMTAAALCTFGILALPWLLGYRFSSDLVIRSEAIFQMGACVAIAALLVKSVRVKPMFLASIALLSLVTFNALAYGVPISSYNSNAPFSLTDSRFGLEAYNSYGHYICRFGPIAKAWGVAIGANFAFCIEKYNAIGGSAGLLPGVSWGNSSVLLRLVSVAGQNQVVVLRMSLDGVSDWPQRLPGRIDQILRPYDIILRSGDVIIAYT